MLNKAYILQLRELGRDDGYLVGGKNANLGELLNAGLPVPDGFAITTNVYDELFSTGNTKEKIKNILNKVDFDNIAILNSCSSKIEKLLKKFQYRRIFLLLSLRIIIFLELTLRLQFEVVQQLKIYLLPVLQDKWIRFYLSEELKTSLNLLKNLLVLYFHLEQFLIAMKKDSIIFL